MHLDLNIVRPRRGPVSCRQKLIFSIHRNGVLPVAEATVVGKPAAPSIMRKKAVKVVEHLAKNRPCT